METLSQNLQFSTSMKMETSPMPGLLSIWKDVSYPVDTLQLVQSLMSSEDFKLLSQILQSPNSQIETLEFIGFVDEKEGGYLADLAALETSLKTLIIDDMRASSDWQSGLFEALQLPSCKLQHLELSHIPLEQNSKEPLMQALTSPNCELESLKISSSWLSDPVVEGLSSALASLDCELRSLCLCGWRASEKNISDIINAISSPHCSLESLDLSRFYNVKSLLPVFEALENFTPNLKALNLRDSQIGVEEAKALAQALKQPGCSIQSVDLRGNKIGKEGLNALVAASHQRSFTFKVDDYS